VVEEGKSGEFLRLCYLCFFRELVQLFLVTPIAFFQEIPGCGKFRKKPLQNEDDLSVIFGDIINDQSDHWNPMSSNPIISPSQEVPADGDNGNLHEFPNDCDHDAAVGDESDYPQEVSPSPTILLANKRNQPAKKPRIGTALVIHGVLLSCRLCSSPAN
jgi:hypothetical protein